MDEQKAAEVVEGGDTPWAELVAKSLTEWDEPEEEKKEEEKKEEKKEDEAEATGEAEPGDEEEELTEDLKEKRTARLAAWKKHRESKSGKTGAGDTEEQEGEKTSEAAAEEEAAPAGSIKEGDSQQSAQGTDAEQAPDAESAPDAEINGQPKVGVAEEAEPVRTEAFLAATAILTSCKHGDAAVPYRVNFHPQAEESSEDAENRADLFAASASGNLQLVEKLLDGEGSALEVMETCEGGNTALHLAVQGGHVDVIKALAGKGADVNAKNKSGQAAIHCATYHNAKVVKALLDSQANVNIKDKENETPLHFGLWFQNVEVIRTLLVAKADVEAHNSRHQSPLDLAKQFSITRTIFQMIEKPETAIKRKRVMPNPKLEFLQQGMKATYEPTGEDVEVVKVHREEEEPYFTVKMPDGREKQTTVDKLKPHEKEEPELKRRKVEHAKKNSVYVVGVPADDPLMNGYFLERYFGACGKVKNTKLYRTKEGGLKGDALVTFQKESEAAAAVKKFHRSEIRAGHIISVSIADFETDKKATAAAVASSTPVTGSRWGAQKFTPTMSGFGNMPGMVSTGGLQGVLPSGLSAMVPPTIMSKQQMAAQKAAEIARQIESLKSVLGKK